MKYLISAAILAIAVLLSSCEHKELCMDHPHIKNLKLAFDWSNAPDASPEGMCVYFYPQGETDGSVQRIDFRGTEGGGIDLQAGIYNIIAYNNDTEAVQFNLTDDFNGHYGFTREGDLFEPIFGSGANRAPRADGSENERITISPDMLWATSATSVEVHGNDQTITLYPDRLVCFYSYEVRNVEHLKHVTMASGALTSMAPSVSFSDSSLGKECVTVPFAAISDGESTITGSFLTFGHHEDNIQPHNMIFYVWMDDGSKWYYTYDVTEQIHQAPDKRRVHIILDGMSLPQPITNGSGFHPSVDEWQTICEDIEM